MKVRLLANINMSTLETEINDFIKDKAVWDVTYRVDPIANSYGRVSATIYSAMIRYEDEDEKCISSDKNKWISVDDKKPERHTRVLCYFKYSPDSPDVIAENTYYSGNHWMSDGSLVTHWMPLPDSPRNEKED